MASLRDLIQPRRSFGFPGQEGEAFDMNNQIDERTLAMLANAPQNFMQRTGGEMVDFGATPIAPQRQTVSRGGQMNPEQLMTASMLARRTPQQAAMDAQRFLRDNPQFANEPGFSSDELAAQMSDNTYSDLLAQRAKSSPSKPEKQEKLQFNAEVGGFIEPPSAQHPQGRIIPVPGMQKKSTSKPLPTAALKLQQEELDAIGSASALNADLGQFKSMVESGKLPLGMTSNWAAEAKNYTGMSDEGSRNYASFKANLERLRNESLRLNKGVQTEGDAIRAWNEILKNINDPELVAQRLGEVAKTNERAIQLRKMNVDAIRGNYGYDPMDVSARENLGSAYGDGQQVTRGGGYEQTATNPQTGQKIGLRNGQWEPIQ